MLAASGRTALALVLCLSIGSGAAEAASYIYGDFEICPLEPVRAGYMRAVCVLSAEKLVVQNLRRSRPAFRLLSTWPSVDAAR